MSENEAFENFIDRYPQTSYGDTSATRDLVFDPRLDTALTTARRAVEQLYVPDLMNSGGEAEAIVFAVIPGQGNSGPLSSFDPVTQALPGTNRQNSRHFTCKCYILSGPESSATCNLTKLREGNATHIELLPSFSGILHETERIPLVGDLVRVKYFENSHTSGRYLGTLDINIMEMMLKEMSDPAVRAFESSVAKYDLSAFDDSQQFKEPCIVTGVSKFFPSELSPSPSLAAEIMSMEGYREYVYDDHRGGRGRWGRPSARQWDPTKHKNHSGYISAYDEGGIVGFPTIGVGHLITEEQKPIFEMYLKQDTTTAAYIPGVDPAPLSKRDIARLLRVDIEAHAGPVRSYVTQLLTQDQFDALCSLVFNIGGRNFSNSRVLRELNAGNCDKAAVAFLDHHYSSSKPLKALLRRRKKEALLFASGRSGGAGPLDLNRFDHKFEVATTSGAPA